MEDIINIHPKELATTPVNIVMKSKIIHDMMLYKNCRIIIFQWILIFGIEHKYISLTIG